jgi:hypothetical protein
MNEISSVMKLNDLFWEKVCQPSDHVVTRKIADETILIPISGNLANMQRIFTVNEIGAAICGLMDGKRTLDEIRRVLLDEFDVEQDRLNADIRDFVERLKEAGLISE